jgi:hypothetical protein
MLLTNKDASRFWTHVQKRGVNDCWLWTGPTKTVNKRYTPMVYGAFSAKVEGKTQSRNAHRYAWIIANNQLPPAGWVICHHCDTPLCCNPAHLFAGTRADNQRDMQRKLRSGIIGEKNPKAKLTREQVLAIRASSARDAELAEQYGVHHTTIYMIRVGRKWRNLPGGAPRIIRRKLSPEQVRELRRCHKAGEMTIDLAKRFGISQGFVSQVALGQCYRSVGE